MKHRRAEISLGILVAALLGLGMYSSLQVTLDQQRVTYRLPTPEPVLRNRLSPMQSERPGNRRIVTHFLPPVEPPEETDPQFTDQDGDGKLDLMPRYCLPDRMPDYSGPGWQLVCQKLDIELKSEGDCESLLTAAWNECEDLKGSPGRPKDCCKYDY